MKSIIDNVCLSSIATCVPSQVVNLIDLGKKYGFSDVDRVCKTTGIYSIREASEETTTSDLCLKAAQDALCLQTSLAQKTTVRP